MIAFLFAFFFASRLVVASLFASLLVFSFGVALLDFFVSQALRAFLWLTGLGAAFSYQDSLCSSSSLGSRLG